MSTIWRIYEIGRKDGRPRAAGWGDHASHASARRAVERWGSVLRWEVDTSHDAVDVTLRVPGLSWLVHVVVEPLSDEECWPTN